MKTLIDLGIIAWFLTLPERILKWLETSIATIWGKALLLSLFALLLWTLAQGSLARELLERFSWFFFLIGGMGLVSSFSWPPIFPLSAVLQGALLSFIVIGRWFGDYQTAWIVWPPLAALCEAVPKLASFWLDPPRDDPKQVIREESLLHLLWALLFSGWLIFGITAQSWLNLYPDPAAVNTSNSAFVRTVWRPIQLGSDDTSIPGQIRQSLERAQRWFNPSSGDDQAILETLRQTIQDQRLQDPSQRRTWLGQLEDPQARPPELLLLNTEVLGRFAPSVAQQWQVGVDLLPPISQPTRRDRVRLVAYRKTMGPFSGPLTVSRDCQIIANVQPVTLSCAPPVTNRELPLIQRVDPTPN